MLGKITSKFPKSRKYINGSPTIIMDNGKIYKENLKKSKLDLSEFMVLCREQGYFNLNDIQTAIFEHNGKLTVLPVSVNRPVTPKDMNLTPKQEHINTELIMDGHIMDENLKRMGLNTVWLENQLKLQGYKNPKEIFLAVCDSNKELSLFPYN